MYEYCAECNFEFKDKDATTGQPHFEYQEEDKAHYFCGIYKDITGTDYDDVEQQLLSLGWIDDEELGWLCPNHAASSTNETLFIDDIELPKPKASYHCVFIPSKELDGLRAELAEAQRQIEKLIALDDFTRKVRIEEMEEFLKPYGIPYDCGWRTGLRCLIKDLQCCGNCARHENGQCGDPYDDCRWQWDLDRR